MNEDESQCLTVKLMIQKLMREVFGYENMLHYHIIALKLGCKQMESLSRKAEPDNYCLLGQTLSDRLQYLPDSSYSLIPRLFISLGMRLDSP